MCSDTTKQMGTLPDLLFDSKMYSNKNTIMSECEEMEYLGTGKYGTVYLVQYRGQTAVRKLGTKYASQQDYLMEAKTLIDVDGAGGAPRLLAVARDHPCLIISYCDGTELDEVTCPYEIRHESLWWMRVFFSLASKLSEFHWTGYIHNDIKGNNVLVNMDDMNYPKAMIIDAGLASNTGIPPPKYKNHSPKDYKNFPDYAPEFFFGFISHPASDVFGLGKMFHGQLKIINSRRASELLWPSEFINLITSMVYKNRRKRPSLNNVIETLRRVIAIIQNKIIGEGKMVSVEAIDG